MEEGIDRLYELAPEEFVAARGELARRLRGEGDAPAAKRVAALRRPTVAAWAVNQAARRRPELVRDLLEAGDRLRQAQRRALSGLRGDTLRTAGSDRRIAIDRLLAVAAEALAESGRSPEAHRDAIAASLQAASTDERAAAAVSAGTLDHELATPSGFGEVAGLELVLPEAPEPQRAPARPKRRRKLDPAQRRELEAARRERERRAKEVRAALRAAGTARAAADEAAEAEAEATRTARRLAEAASRAKRDAEDARRAAEEARRVADEARQAADTARTRSQRASRRARDTLEEAVEAESLAATAQEALERAERRIGELESAD
ncbi:MAG TPA: hypothetical protein VGA45_20060 [Actinomycetota bacterium]